MKVLWLCNLIMPKIAEQLHIEGSNKEGWVTGLADVVLQNRACNNVELAVAFPVPGNLLETGKNFNVWNLTYDGVPMECYGFREDVDHPEKYDEGLEDSMAAIAGLCAPDLVHCFGTEFPHTLAMCRVFPDKQKLLITLQGLCSAIANVYFADLPEYVTKRATFRDLIKRDSLRIQKEKFVKRGEHEIEAVKIAGNIGGRTDWDKFYTKLWNPSANYFLMGETLRGLFYEAKWEVSETRPHSMFVCQGDYPAKGLHYLLLAMPRILEQYPDAKIYVAGNSITSYETLKQKLKICSYGKYLRELMEEYHLFDKVEFLGRLSAEEIRAQYLRSSLYVGPSAIENSSNSLAEAMLMGMPCVCSDVGGTPSMFTDGTDGILYEGCRSEKNAFDNVEAVSPHALTDISDRLAEAILKMWSGETDVKIFCENASSHAERDHDRRGNYENTISVYAQIAGKTEGNV